MEDTRILHWRNPSRDIDEYDGIISIINTLGLTLVLDKENRRQLIRGLNVTNFYYFIKLLKEEYDIMIREDYIALDKKGWRFTQR